MTVLHNSTIIAGASGSQATGYNLTKSLRFRSSAYLSRTPASAGNRKTWTWSAWVKRGSLSSNQFLLSTGSAGSSDASIYFSGSDFFKFEDRSGSNITTAAVYRDPSAWYHLMVVVDTTQATSSNRFKLYVNGLQITSFDGTPTYPSQNADLYINNNTLHYIGRRSDGLYFDGYQTELNLIDGQALTPSSFGEYSTSTGVWKPKKYSGTYGTNGFYLPFSDNSSTTTLGYDKSGNSNNWTTNNISLTAGSTYDSMVDVPTMSALGSNYCVLNPLTLFGNSNTTMSNANMNLQLGVAGQWRSYSGSSIVMSDSGKWYFEVTPLSGTAGEMQIGVATSTLIMPTGNYNAGSSANAWIYQGDGIKANSGSGASYGSAFTVNDVIGVALDITNGQLTFYKNGVSQGVAYTLSTTNSYVCCLAGASSAPTFACNFGQRPFAYTPPTGFVALNTFNLPEPSIKQGNKHFDALTYTGNGSSSQRTDISWANIQPDFVWLKNRSSANNHVLHDDVRGCAEALQSNLTNAVDTPVGFGSDGFGFGGVANQLRVWTADGRYNTNGNSYVAWGWKASGASAVSNTAGSITSQVSANPSAGFSVVTYTGSGVDGATIGHGLGVAPKMIITKRRNAVGDWYTYHASLGTGYVLVLQGTNGQITTSNSYKAVSSSTYTVGLNGDMNTSGGTYVAYCFAEVAGFSKFGSYTGNGNTSGDGPFVYLGFKPRYIMIKRTDTTGFGWYIRDTARDTYNVGSNYLEANSSNAEGSGNVAYLDYLSNGFKLKNTAASDGINANGGTYIYMAFAENPFKNSLAR